MFRFATKTDIKYYKSFAISLNCCIFAMFFMVLDLRLTRLGLSGAPFFMPKREIMKNIATNGRKITLYGFLLIILPN